jgi:hypothetical protein
MQVPEPIYFGVKVIAQREGDPPFPASFQITVNSYSRDADGVVILGPTAMTDSEVDYTIDSMTNELETARRVAKKHLHRK